MVNNKRKSGFTLIELLAVILILGIIALIAIPTVTNIIKESKRGAFKSSVQNLMGAVETKCQVEQMKGEELTTSYTLANGSIDKELNIKGNLPQSGTITVDSSCNVTLTVSDGDFCAAKALEGKDVLVGDIKDGECSIEVEKPACTINHVAPTLSLDEDSLILTITKNSTSPNNNSPEESFDVYVWNSVLIEGELTEEHIGKFTIPEGTEFIEVDVGPYLGHGTHIYEVKTTCELETDNEELKATLEYYDSGIGGGPDY